MSDNPQWEIIQGDALKVLSGFAPGTFDAVITDPPYEEILQYGRPCPAAL